MFVSWKFVHPEKNPIPIPVFYFQVMSGVNSSPVKKFLFNIALAEKEKELKRCLLCFCFDVKHIAKWSSVDLSCVVESISHEGGLKWSDKVICLVFLFIYFPTYHWRFTRKSVKRRKEFQIWIEKIRKFENIGGHWNILVSQGCDPEIEYLGSVDVPEGSGCTRGQGQTHRHGLCTFVR